MIIESMELTFEDIEVFPFNGDTKICKSCDLELGVSEFSQAKTRNTIYWRGTCDMCLGLWKYKLTRTDYVEKLAQQDGRCAICGTRDSGTRRFHVDHDHDCCSGKTMCGRCNRGLLCGDCNFLLGFAHDDLRILENAMNYLASVDNIFEDE
jgi:hypothetical protein